MKVFLDKLDVIFAEKQILITIKAYIIANNVNMIYAKIVKKLIKILKIKNVLKIIRLIILQLDN
jgi:hypothetical protein